MADVEHDPCAPDVEGVFDLGHGMRVRFTTYRGVRAGLIESHDRPDGGGRCAGALTFDVPETRAAFPDRPRWRVVSMDPLELDPSVLCRTCGHHGHIRAGRWEPC